MPRLAKQVCQCGHPKWQHEDYPRTKCNAHTDAIFCTCQEFRPQAARFGVIQGGRGTKEDRKQRVIDTILYQPAAPPMDLGSGLAPICSNCPNALDDCYPDSQTHCSIKPRSV